MKNFVTLLSSGVGDNWGTQTVVTDVTLAGNDQLQNRLERPEKLFEASVLK